MITHPGEYHDAVSNIPIPQSRQTLGFIERGRQMSPLPIQIALRSNATPQVASLDASWPAEARAA